MTLACVKLIPKTSQQRGLSGLYLLQILRFVINGQSSGHSERELLMHLFTLSNHQFGKGLVVLGWVRYCTCCRFCCVGVRAYIFPRTLITQDANLYSESRESLLKLQKFQIHLPLSSQYKVLMTEEKPEYSKGSGNITSTSISLGRQCLLQACLKSSLPVFQDTDIMITLVFPNFQ